MWDLWIITVSGSRLFVDRYANQNEARFFMFAWWERGFFPLKNDGPREFTAFAGHASFAYIEPAVGALPAQNFLDD